MRCPRRWPQHTVDWRGRCALARKTRRVRSQARELRVDRFFALTICAAPRAFTTLTGSSHLRKLVLELRDRVGDEHRLSGHNNRLSGHSQ